MQLDILQMISQQIGQFTKSQKKVADYIVKNPMLAAFSTVDQLARTIEVSTTTIIRLTLALGFTGYAEFQRSLQDYLQNRTGPATKLEINIKNTDIDNEIVGKIVQQQMDNFSETFHNLSDDMIINTINMLSKAKNIYIAGERSFFSVAYYLHFNLERIYGNCNLITSAIGVVPEKLSKITENDIFIAISLPRHIKQVALYCDIAKKRKAKIIVLTDGYTSPIAQNADIVFSALSKTLDFHNSLIGLILIAEVIIGAASYKKREQIKERLEEVEEVLDVLKIHLNK